MKGKLKQKKGITLIALIITIIILLILAVVSIRLVMNNGILGKAEHATQKYTEEEAAEQEKLLKAEYEMAKYEGKFNGSYDSYKVWKQYGVKIGDYVAYDPTKDENGNPVATTSYTSYSAENASSDKNNGRSSGFSKDQVFNLSSYTGGWRVLGIENGQLQLISAGVIGPDVEWSNCYALEGKVGIKDGPGELNAIAGIYGRGKGATGARSINVDDINKITGYNPAKTGDGKPYNSGNMNEYGNKVTYYWDGTANPYYEYGEGESKKTENLSSSHSTSFEWYDGTNWKSSAKDANASISDRKRIIELTSTTYSYNATTLINSSSGDIKGIAKTSKEWDVLFGGAATSYAYWLAWPYVSCYPNYTSFGLFHASDSWVGGLSGLYGSSGWSYPSFYLVRPVVSLKSDIQIEKTETNDGSTLAKACIIK